jgi:hypothetical protein
LAGIRQQHLTQQHLTNVGGLFATSPAMARALSDKSKQLFADYGLAWCLLLRLATPPTLATFFTTSPAMARAM